MALQLKAVASGYQVLTGPPGGGASTATAWWRDSTLYVALALAGFTILFGTRHLDTTERHEGMVAAIALEAVVKLAAFVAVGVFVTWGLFDGPADLFARAQAVPDLARLLRLDQGQGFAYEQWFALTLLSMFSVIFLPRQFQVMVVENVDERHIRRASWAFPLYLFAINLFVLPIALGGMLQPGATTVQAETFVLSLPLASGHGTLAMFAFVGGLSAATGMVIVEAIAVSTMVCNDLVMPWLLRTRRFGARSAVDLTRVLLGLRRAAIVGMLLLGYLYFRLAGEAYALVSIGLISFAAVAQFAPTMLGGIYWRGGTRNGALAGLAAGFVLWAYTLMLPSIAKSGWLADDFLRHGLFGVELLKPERLLGLGTMDNLTHSLFWSLLVNAGAYLVVSLWRRPSGAEASQALMFVDVFQPRGAGGARGRGLRRHEPTTPCSGAAARTCRTCSRSPGASSGASGRTRSSRTTRAASAPMASTASRRTPIGAVRRDPARRGDRQRVGARDGGGGRRRGIARLDDVMRILEETSQIRAYSQALEEKSRSLEQATAGAARGQRAAEEPRSTQGRLHVVGDPRTAHAADLDPCPGRTDARRAAAWTRRSASEFVAIVVTETERLTRLVNQVLDMAKIESGHARMAQQRSRPARTRRQAVQTTTELFRERGAQIHVDMPARVPTLRADRDRLMQVMLNLLSNAAKFVPAHGGRIDVRCAPQPGRR